MTWQSTIILHECTWTCQNFWLSLLIEFIKKFLQSHATFDLLFLEKWCSCKCVIVHTIIVTFYLWNLHMRFGMWFFFLIRFNFFSDGPFKKLCGSNTHIQFGGSWLSTTIQRVYVTLWVGALTSSKLTLIGVK